MGISKSCWAERTRMKGVGLTRRRRGLRNRCKREARLLLFFAICAGHGDYYRACKSGRYNALLFFVGDVNLLSTDVVDRNKCEAITVYRDNGLQWFTA